MKKSDHAGRPGDESPMTRKQWRDRLQIGKPAINLHHMIQVRDHQMAPAQAARLACGENSIIEACQFVSGLLGRGDWARLMLGEASVHRKCRSTIWQASFTGPFGGQVWKSTGTDDHATAQAIAQGYEVAARAQRARSSRAGPQPSVRHRQVPGRSGGGLTQREVAMMLKISERGVRTIERRALRKLAQHPQLREIWRSYLAGEISEEAHHLSAPEIRALLGLARNPAEHVTLLKVLAIIHN
jgi:DNA-binding CsgD family transcriptional regulator